MTTSNRAKHNSWIRLFSSRSNSNAIDGETGSRRRSLRKREGKSYTEFGETDIYFEDDNSGPNSPVKGLNSRKPNAHKMNSESAPVSNGDVEMESEDDSDDDGPLEPLPLPKVSQKFI